MINKTKNSLHPRNKHRAEYDFTILVAKHPNLKAFVAENDYGKESINFFNPKAVIALNTALLKHFYGIEHYEIPSNYLCPPVPGRADYLHYLADLLPTKKVSKKVTCLDIGTGANCIYPIIGNRAYGWHFVASEIDPKAFNSAQVLLNKNASIGLNQSIVLRLQQDASQIFKGIIKPSDYFECTLCNPPFHESAQKAHAASLRKVKNLKQTSIKKVTLNFGGQANELWCEGGERQFLTTMIKESVHYSKQVGWFTSLVSKQETLPYLIELLNKVHIKEHKIIPMSQGNKTSRILAWRFLSKT